VRNIGEKKLADITDLSTLNETIDYDTITTPTNERIFTILERGLLWSEAGEANTRRLFDFDNPVYPAELTPALRYDYILEQIFADAGFELVAGSLLTILSNYYMPWLNSKAIVGSDSFNDNFFRVYNSASVPLSITPTAIPLNTEVFDNGNDFNPATYTYTTPTTGYYTFRVLAYLTGTANVFVKLRIDGVDILIDNYFINTSGTIDVQYRIGIDAGSAVQLLLSTQTATSVISLDAGDGTFNSTIFELVKTEFRYGQTIFYNLNAPDAKQIDFLTDVIKMHNCAIVPDRMNANKIYIVPQNNYLGSGNELDWTGKLDTSKDIVISSAADLQKAKFQFTYTAGEDVISQVYKNVNRVYGDYEVSGYTVNPAITPSDFAIGDQKIQLVTQSTPCGVVNGSNTVLPMFINAQLEFVAPGMRCLFHAGDANIELYNDNTGFPSVSTTPVLSHYSQVIADIDDEDLNWAPEVPTYNIIANPYANLFNKYWRTYMNALYSPSARLMEASFALDLKDILTFQFSDKIWIQNAWWRILEINDYKVGMNESTQVKLLKFLEDTEDCSATPVSISTNGEVNFEDGAGDPVLATQDCCTRYGYNWDEENAVCWAFTSTGTRPTNGVSGNATSPASRPTTAAVQNRSVFASVINGENITIESGNYNMLAVGSKLELTKAVQGSNLLGKNTYTNLPGIHLGGGYRSGNIANTEKGWAQSGTVILHYKDAWIDSQTFNLYIEGITAEYLELPDDTIWSCLMNATILDTGTGNYCIGQYSFGLQKIGGNANATAVTVINEDNGTAYTFVFGIDTAANAAQHRINLQVNGLGILTETFIVTASIQYQQNTSV
jgi:hypothetical protein